MAFIPRALPWAGLFGPVGAGSRAVGKWEKSTWFRRSSVTPLKGGVNEKEGEIAGLLREFDAAGFADDGDADLARVLQFFFDFAREAAGQCKGLFVVDLIGLDQHAEFAAGLDGEAFLDAGIGAANFFEVFDALDIGGHGFGAGAGA